jgi:hypothetical protein
MNSAVEPVGSGLEERGTAVVEQHGPWVGAGAPPAGWRPPTLARPPSGLFPGGPARPSFREPYPVRAGALLAGLGSGLLWMTLFGAIGRDLLGYAWWTLIASLTAWAVSAVLSFFGDRGVAVGVALAAGLGWSVAAFAVAARWIGAGDWPMW